MNFHPPFSEPLLSFLFSYPSNIEIILDFSDIIAKIHPPFQNPRSALEGMNFRKLHNLLCLCAVECDSVTLLLLVFVTT